MFDTKQQIDLYRVGDDDELIGVRTITALETPLRFADHGGEGALYLVFKVILRLSGNWRALNGVRIG